METLSAVTVMIWRAFCPSNTGNPSPIISSGFETTIVGSL
jgi:hypothetical protein